MVTFKRVAVCVHIIFADHFTTWCQHDHWLLESHHHHRHHIHHHHCKWFVITIFILILSRCSESSFPLELGSEVGSSTDEISTRFWLWADNVSMMMMMITNMMTMMMITMIMIMTLKISGGLWTHEPQLYQVRLDYIILCGHHYWTSWRENLISDPIARKKNIGSFTGCRP